MTTPALFLLTGKGGAGKTTTAAALALALADAGHTTRIASLDPAHNLGDVLGVDVGPRATSITPRLSALEVDIEGHMNAQIRATRDLVRQRYRYLAVGSLDPLIDLLGQAPGAEEQAAVEIMLDLAQKADESGDDLILDLPPSGQALRMLALPALTARWAQSLLKLRSRILSRRGSIHHILRDESPTVDADGTSLPEDPDRDPVTLNLRRHLARHQAFADRLKDAEQARVIVVSLPSAICLSETRRLLAGLKKRACSQSALVINRANDAETTQISWPETPNAFVPDLGHEPRGVDELRRLNEALRCFI